MPLAIIAFVAAAFLLGRLARSELGIEFSADSIRDFVSGLGWAAPLLFLAVVTFRNFLLLPSMLVLPAGGLAFGAVTGTLLGAGGIAISALMKFALGRGVAREWLHRRWLHSPRSRMGAASGTLGQRVEAAGPLLVGLVTANPAGPMSAVHWGAGFSTLAVRPFLVAVVAGGLVRAFVYSFFGSTLLETGTPRFYVSAAVLAVVTLAPLLHPGLRGRILRMARDDVGAPV
ncbi:MAG: VTT domain-containing protein [Proteobacteria bacterium]|nr:VTT domain-containing protein [Pseudomonadota bacterium]